MSKKQFEHVLAAVGAAEGRIINSYESMDNPEFELGFLEALRSILCESNKEPFSAKNVCEYVLRYCAYMKKEPNALYRHTK